MNTIAANENTAVYTTPSVYSKEQIQKRFEELSADDLFIIISIHHNYKITPLSEGAQMRIGDKAYSNGFELYVQIPMGRKQVYKLVSYHTDLLGLARKGTAQLINYGYIMPEALFSYSGDIPVTDTTDEQK